MRAVCPVAVTVALAVGGALLPACSAEVDDAAPGARGGVDAESDTTPEQRPADADDDEEPPAPEEIDPAPVGPVGTLERASEDFPRWGGGPVHLADARLFELDGVDRLVLEFDGELPSWQVRPITGPLLEQPGRSEVELEGDRVLEVRLVPATSIDRGADEPMASYDGPEYLTSDSGGIREALVIADASDILSWAVGIEGTSTVAVGVLEDPDRLVLDVSVGDG